MIALGESRCKATREGCGHVRLAHHGQGSQKVRCRQPDHTAQTVRCQRALQQAELAPGDQPFESMFGDIAVDRLLVLAGRGNDHMRQGGKTFERQLAAGRRVIGADHPHPGLLKQRLVDKWLWDPPEAADCQVDAPGKKHLGNTHIARPDPQLGIRC